MQLSTKKKELWKNKKLHSCLYERPAGDVRSLIRQLKKPEIKKIKRNDIRCSNYVYIVSLNTMTFV